MSEAASVPLLGAARRERIEARHMPVGQRWAMLGSPFEAVSHGSTAYPNAKQRPGVS